MILLILAVIIGSALASPEANGYAPRAVDPEPEADRVYCETDAGFIGFCMTKLKCGLQGGAAAGNCGPIGVCCEINPKCGSSSSLKVTRIRTPSRLATPCTYTIEPYSSNVCQVKIDMVELSLKQPEKADVTDEIQCLDSLQVNGMTICGNNHGQHLHVPFDVSGGQADVTIAFDIPSGDSAAQWELIVTQLECPANADPTDVDSVIRIQNDLKVLAPLGCNQYFTERTGTFESFNYNDGTGPYMGGFNYAICFQRQVGDSAIEFSFVDFGLPSQLSNNGFDNDCHPLIVTVGKTEDFLMIPMSTYSPSLQPTFFCGKYKEQLKVLAGGAGPFVVYFKSDEFWSEEDIGFRIEYKIVKDV